MCGICGVVSLDGKLRINESVIRSMNRVMHHRGPDDEGVYVGSSVAADRFRVGLGHRRLSIIDLSPNGHQPMSNEDGTVWIVFNGEIYNFSELKQYLISRGHRFKSHSDTEVIVHLYEEEGARCVEKLRGMFAFAIWDDRKKQLFLVRDRLGIKPLYYSVCSDGIVFASEAKAILQSGYVSATVKRNVLDAYVTLGYVPGPSTMFDGINKLLPGYALTYSEGHCREEKYWDIDGIAQRYDRSENELAEELMSLLDECVRMRLVSDVPLGVFLSGGIDSSIVVALMSRMIKEPVKTFTVGYKEKDSSELQYARLMARHCGTDHHEFILEPADFYDFIPKLVWYFDEPVVEAAAIPLYFISKLARDHVTVLLSGEGADELFAGYPIYRYMMGLERYRAIPRVLRKVLFNPLLPLLLKSKKKRSKYLLWSEARLEDRYLGVPVEIQEDFKKRLYSPAFRAVGTNRAKECLRPYYDNVQGRDDLSRMLYVDTKVWLPDDLLLKADKMSMAASVELRVPFLDYKLVEFATSVPSHFKLRHWTNKYLLKRAAHKHLPKEIIYRKKRGFPVPINAWFSGDFSEKAKEVLLDQSSIGREYFDERCIMDVIEKHRQGVEDYSKTLFSLIVLEMWHKVFVDQSVHPF